VQVDELIVELGEKLDAWFDENVSIFASEDRAAQSKGLRAGIEIAKELDRLKARGLTAIKALLNRHDTVTEDQRVASLVRGFEFAAKLANTLSDELMDTDGFNKLVLLMNSIVDTLDATSQSRAALTVLLDHPDDGIRAFAGAYLIDLMPDRVVPILRQIDERHDGSSANFTALWALADWKLKEKGKQG
jgi:hypothetical protein